MAGGGGQASCPTPIRPWNPPEAAEEHLGHDPDTSRWQRRSGQREPQPTGTCDQANSVHIQTSTCAWAQVGFDTDRSKYEQSF